MNPAEAPVVVWGGRGHALVVAELVGTRTQPIAVVVDRDPSITSPLGGVPLVTGHEGLDGWLRTWEGPPLAFAVAIGGGRGADRRALHQHLIDRGLTAAPLVHPAAHVTTTATIGPGSQVLAGAVVAAAAALGTQVIVNTAASVDHECHLDDGAHIGPGATLAGDVHVERDAFVGAGATVLPGLRIGTGAVVGAGAVVTRDVAPRTIVVGVPAREIASTDPVGPS